MITIGTLVNVTYPDYARDIIGKIEAKENNRRWLVRLDKNSINHKQESILLSLNESEFKIYR